MSFLNVRETVDAVIYMVMQSEIRMLHELSDNDEYKGIRYLMGRTFDRIRFAF